ncbi:unnamed protein product [Caenorhabditis bovis]|uniref:Uncharacterized protein n=1 Tax=Caenorhabditis bovis TaxID=2654633 RepID=A0A8S1EIM1_9PELO|nr:unnamed protein product [Caenorhabditis bovis]
MMSLIFFALIVSSFAQYQPPSQQVVNGPKYQQPIFYQPPSHNQQYMLPYFIRPSHPYSFNQLPYTGVNTIGSPYQMYDLVVRPQPKQMPKPSYQQINPFLANLPQANNVYGAPVESQGANSVYGAPSGEKSSQAIEDTWEALEASLNDDL